MNAQRSEICMSEISQVEIVFCKLIKCAVIKIGENWFLRGNTFSISSKLSNSEGKCLKLKYETYLWCTIRYVNQCKVAATKPKTNTAQWFRLANLERIFNNLCWCYIALRYCNTCGQMTYLHIKLKKITDINTTNTYISYYYISYQRGILPPKLFGGTNKTLKLR